MGKFFCLVIVFLSINSGNGLSQNLLLNGDFEDINTDEPKSNFYKYSFYFKNWFEPTDCSSDIYRDFKVCDEKHRKAHEPTLDFCVQVQSGNYCAGIYLIYYSGDVEYLSGTLSNPLEANQLYKISYWLKFGAGEDPAASIGFGYKLSKDSIVFKSNVSAVVGLESNYNSLFSVHRVYADHSIKGTFLNTEWTKIETLYKAKGGEKFITFGMFCIDNDKKIKKQFLQFTNNPILSRNKEFIYKDKSLLIKKLKEPKQITNKNLDQNYYFLDNVGVFALDSLDQAKYEAFPFCVDSDTSTSFPAFREYSNLFDNKGWVGDMEIKIVAHLKPNEKLFIQYGNKKEIVIVNDLKKLIQEPEEFIYTLKYPVKKLRGKLLRWSVEMTNEEEVRLFTSKYGKWELYISDLVNGKIFKN